MARWHLITLHIIIMVVCMPSTQPGCSYSTAGGKVSCVPRYPTVSHKFPRDILCPVVIRSISENFCDYHGTWLSSRYNHRNFRHGWLPQNCRDTMSPVVICGIPWDTVRHGETLPPAVLYVSSYIKRGMEYGRCILAPHHVKKNIACWR